MHRRICCRIERPLRVSPKQGSKLPPFRVPPARRRRRMHRSATDRPETTVLGQEALGQHPLLQERPERYRLRYWEQRDSDYAGHRRRSWQGWRTRRQSLQTRNIRSPDRLPNGRSGQSEGQDNSDKCSYEKRSLCGIERFREGWQTTSADLTARVLAPGSSWQQIKRNERRTSGNQRSRFARPP